MCTAFRHHQQRKTISPRTKTNCASYMHTSVQKHVRMIRLSDTYWISSSNRKKRKRGGGTSNQCYTTTSYQYNFIIDRHHKKKKQDGARHVVVVIRSPHRGERVLVIPPNNPSELLRTHVFPFPSATPPRIPLICPPPPARIPLIFGCVTPGSHARDLLYNNAMSNDQHHDQLDTNLDDDTLSPSIGKRTKQTPTDGPTNLHAAPGRPFFTDRTKNDLPTGCMMHDDPRTAPAKDRPDDLPTARKKNDRPTYLPTYLPTDDATCGIIPNSIRSRGYRVVVLHQLIKI